MCHMPFHKLSQRVISIHEHPILPKEKCSNPLGLHLPYLLCPPSPSTPELAYKSALATPFLMNLSFLENQSSITLGKVNVFSSCHPKEIYSVYHVLTVPLAPLLRLSLGHGVGTTQQEEKYNVWNDYLCRQKRSTWQ